MRKQFIIFILILSTLLFYTSYKINQSLQIPLGTAVALCIPLFILMFGSIFIARASSKMTETKLFQVFTAIGSVVMGLWSTFFLFSIGFDIFKILIIIFYSLFRPEGLYYDFLLHLFSKIEFYIIPISILISFFGFLEVLRGPIIKKINVKRNSVNNDLNDLTIAQISDLHIGATLRSGYVNKVVDKTNSLHPDIIVLTGDIIDGNINALQNIVAILDRLKSTYGVYYVTGNHEYYWNIESILQSLSALKIKILLNENTIIKVGHSNLLIAGISDPTARSMHPGYSPDILKASATSESVSFKLLLAHQPGIYDKANDLNFDLLLSGHTHAGQFFPFNLLVGFAHRYYRGLHKHKNMHLYVNPGTGYWGPINRFGVPAEITLLKLTKE